MPKIIAIAGKEGSGKTTVAVNLSLALKNFRKNVLLIDLNTENPNIGLYMDATPTKTLGDFLKGTSLEEIVYRHSSGLGIIFSSLAEQLESLPEMSNLVGSFKNYDFIILDCDAASLEAAAGVSSEILFVSSPYLPSIVEVAKQKQLIETKMENPRFMLLLNRVRKKRYELTAKEIVAFSDLPITSIIPEDETVLESANEKKPLLMHKPNSRAGKAFAELASKLAKRI